MVVRKPVKKRESNAPIGMQRQMIEVATFLSLSGNQALATIETALLVAGMARAEMELPMSMGQKESPEK